MRLLSLIVALALACCGPMPSGNDASQESEYDQSFSLQIKAEKAVKNQLKDPEAAQFDDGEIYNTTTQVVCGRVNARNSFGGMTGKQMFVYHDGQVLLEEEMSNEQASQSAILCGSARPRDGLVH